MPASFVYQLRSLAKSENRSSRYWRHCRARPNYLNARMNVALVQPFDDVVMNRTSERDGLKVAALSQVAADLLTSLGAARAKARR